MYILKTHYKDGSKGNIGSKLGQSPQRNAVNCIRSLTRLHVDRSAPVARSHWCQTSGAGREEFAFVRRAFTSWIYKKSHLYTGFIAEFLVQLKTSAKVSMFRTMVLQTERPLPAVVSPAASSGAQWR